MGMFAIALAAFIALHVGVSATGLRTVLVKAMGEWPYRGLFSVLTAIVLGWMIWSYGGARVDPANTLLWSPPDWSVHLGRLFIVLGLLLAFTGLLSPSPTTVGMESQLKKPDVAVGVLRITRHSFMWGVALWGFGHVLANGERAAVMLFGGLALMVLFGSRSIDRKSAARDPENWARFKAVTSNVPFAAIVQGRNKLALGELAWRLIVAAAVVALIYWAHPFLFGAAPA